MALQTPLGSPQWDTPHWTASQPRRLKFSLWLAAAVVLLLSAFVRMPDFAILSPVLDLIVNIVNSPVEEETAPPLDLSVDAPMIEEAVEDVPGVMEEQPADTEATESAPAAAVEPANDVSAAASATVDSVVEAMVESPTDWQALGEEAISAALDRLENPPSANPVLDAKRRAAAGQYRPPTIEGEKPIWENVEKDQIGRSVLRSGDCFKVIDDPNVTRQYQFEQFDQWLVQCAFIKRNPQLLPWVDEIVDRYLYLKYPDGEIPAEELPQRR